MRSSQKVDRWSLNHLSVVTAWVCTGDQAISEPCPPLWPCRQMRWVRRWAGGKVPTVFHRTVLSVPSQTTECATECATEWAAAGLQNGQGYTRLRHLCFKLRMDASPGEPLSFCKGVFLAICECVCLIIRKGVCASPFASVCASSFASVCASLFASVCASSFSGSVSSFACVCAIWSCSYVHRLWLHPIRTW